MWKSFRLPDWNELRRNWILVIYSIGFIGFLSYFFYHVVWMMIPLLPVGYIFYLIHAELKKEKEDLQYLLEFKEMIYSISANLQAGYAIENAIAEAKKDLLMLYGEHTQIVKACNELLKGIHNQVPIEVLFYEMGQNSNIAEMIDFASVFVVAKRTGGNLVSIIQSTSQVISNKIEVKNDIQTMIAAKQMEANIMCMIPFGIAGYISLTTPAFFRDMYGNPRGIMIMTGCLGLYLVAYFWMKKICKIKI